MSKSAPLYPRRSAPYRVPLGSRWGIVSFGLAGVVLLLMGCGGSSGPGQGGDQPPVAVATTTQLGSVLSRITECAGATSSTVMGPGDDPHDFAASSQQVAQMTAAKLVVSNGLELEAGMQTALDNAEADGAVLLEVAPEVDPLPFAAHDQADTDGHGQSEGDGGGHAGESGHGAGTLDPHFWMDVGRMAAAAGVIGNRLAEAADDERYAQCGEQVAAELRHVDEQIAGILAGIPKDRRTLVTDHAAYNYFVDAYGLDVAGVVVPGGSTEAKPSSQQLTELHREIDNEGADALVTSVGADNPLIRALSEETGGAVPVVELYEGGLGPEGSGAESYEEAMLFNANALAEALAGAGK